MTVFYGPRIRCDHLKTMDDFLTARGGWELDDYFPRDDEGCPADPESTWHYRDSFGGIAMSKVDDVTPYGLSCRFGFGGGLSIVVGSAGNYYGCPDHNEQEHRIDVVNDELDLDRLGALLDDLEPHARALDPRELIECRFFGSCGDVS